MFKAIYRWYKSRFSMTFVSTTSINNDGDGSVHKFVDCYGDMWLATGIFGMRTRINK
jgi:hypothetical protein